VPKPLLRHGILIFWPYEIFIAVATGEVTILGDHELGIEGFGIKDALCALQKKPGSRHAGPPLSGSTSHPTERIAVCRSYKRAEELGIPSYFQRQSRAKRGVSSLKRALRIVSSWPAPSRLQRATSTTSASPQHEQDTTERRAHRARRTLGHRRSPIALCHGARLRGCAGACRPGRESTGRPPRWP
jgi:hypothetical protein